MVESRTSRCHRRLRRLLDIKVPNIVAPNLSQVVLLPLTHLRLKAHLLSPDLIEAANSILQLFASLPCASCQEEILRLFRMDLAPLARDSILKTTDTSLELSFVSLKCLKAALELV